MHMLIKMVPVRTTFARVVVGGCLGAVALLAGSLWTHPVAAAETASAPVAKPIPVIFDTDIGDDIDDTWALVMLLKSPQFDLKLVTTTAGKAEYRAKLVAKTLETAGRKDVAVGLGTGGRGGSGGQEDWVKDYKLANYPGKVQEDGVAALLETVNALSVKGALPTIIAVGPLHTLGEALKRDPSLARKASFAGMHGSVRRGYDNSPTPCVEYNMTYVPGAQTVFAAPWHSAAFTPLDTCGLVNLSGPRFQRLKDSDDILVKTLLENYRIWAKKKTVAEMTGSSVLFDTVAVYLADPGPKLLLELENLNITVNDKGMTMIDPAGLKMSVATRWTSVDGYRDHLVERLLAPTVVAH